MNKNGVDHRRWTPLMCAVAIQDIETVKALLEGGVECNEPLRHNACKYLLDIFTSTYCISVSDRHLVSCQLSTDVF